MVIYSEDGTRGVNTDDLSGGEIADSDANNRTSDVSNNAQSNVDRPQSQVTTTGRNWNNQADEASPGSPEPGTSCPDQCTVCTEMPGVRESFALHRMRNRRRRMAMRSCGSGRRGLRRSAIPSQPLAPSSAHPPRERTQTLASYIDSEVRRVLGQQDGQESDSSDSTLERNEPTALIIPPVLPSSARSSSPPNSDVPNNSSIERRRLMYERLMTDVSEMEGDMRDLRSLNEMHMENLMRYQQRREDRQRRIDERLHLSAVPGSNAGRGRTGARLSRFQNLRVTERHRRNRLRIEDLRIRYGCALMFLEDDRHCHNFT